MLIFALFLSGPIRFPDFPFDDHYVSTTKTTTIKTVATKKNHRLMKIYKASLELSLDAKNFSKFNPKEEIILTNITLSFAIFPATIKLHKLIFKSTILSIFLFQLRNYLKTMEQIIKALLLVEGWMIMKITDKQTIAASDVLL